MSDADFYAFHLEHMKQHFTTGGCGIRFFLDLWILNHSVKDKQEKKREEKLERCGLTEFEYAVRSVTEVWFGKAEHTELTHQVERFILAGGGVYGSVENWAIVQKVRNQGKLKSVIRRIWLPYEELCWSYPSLEGKRYIQPYYEAKRFFKMIADGRWNRSVQELKANAKGQELSDVKVITDLMMGGDGLNPAPELTELHFSAICEAMNQMMGSSATSLSSMLNCKIDISPPEAELVDMAGNIDVAKASDFLDKDFVRVTFRMTIGDLVDSTIMQLYPIQFARDLYKKFSGESEEKEETPPPAPQPEPQPQPVPQPQPQPQPATGMPMGQPMMGQSMMPQMMQPDVNVQNVQFQAFNPVMNPALQQENIDLIMDVPLEVSVVLGRTRKSIKEILEFAPGTIIELDKLAGEPIDVMVNQKLVCLQRAME